MSNAVGPLALAESLLEDVWAKANALQENAGAMIDRKGTPLVDSRISELRDGDVQLVLRECDKAEALGHDVSNIRFRLHLKLGDLLYQISRELKDCEGSRDWNVPLIEAAIDEFSQATEIRPAETLPRFYTGIAHQRLATAFNDGASISKARQVFQRLVDDFPGSEHALKAAKELARLEQVEEEQKKSGCFVATACCGSASAREVMTLRAYRDSILDSSAIGRALTRWYYRNGPAAAALVVRRPLLRTICRCLLVVPAAWLAGLSLRRRASGRDRVGR